jgi:hypothetical protein
MGALLLLLLLGPDPRPDGPPVLGADISHRSEYQ